MKELNILVYPSKEYLKYLYVLLLSIFETHKSVKINIHIFEMDYTEQDKKEVTSYCEKYDSSCYIYHIDPQIYEDFPIYSNKWPIHHLFDILPHYYLPKEMDKILCLETDMIVTERLDELYDMDFQDNYMICAPAKSIVEKNEKAPVFNTGTILFNLNKMREDNINIDDFYRAAEELRKNGSVINDLLMFNCLFRQKGALILKEDGLKWNFRYSVYEDHIKKYGRDRIIQGLQPHIVHYMLREFPYKPWDICFTDEEIVQYKSFYNNRYFRIIEELNDYYKLWWKLAEKTPCYETMKERMTIIKNYVMSMLNGTLQEASNKTEKMEKEIDFLRSRLKKAEKELIYYRVLNSEKFRKVILDENNSSEEIASIRGVINSENCIGEASSLVPRPDKVLVETGQFRSLIFKVEPNKWYRFIRLEETSRLTIFGSDSELKEGGSVVRINHALVGNCAKFHTGKADKYILIYVSVTDMEKFPLVQFEECV